MLCRRESLVHSGRICDGVATSLYSRKKVCDVCWSPTALRSLTRSGASILRVRAQLRGGACICWSPRAAGSGETSRGIRSGEIIKRSLRD